MTKPSQGHPSARPDPRPVDTAEFSQEEILARLELGRVHFEATEGGSRLKVTHVNAPPEERRAEEIPPPEGVDRRNYHPVEIPTLFPEKGPILLLVVGGLSDELGLRNPVPFWRDDNVGSLVWQALARAGLVHRKDAAAMAIGQGGFWELDPPRTQGLAITYSGFCKRGAIADFHALTRSWNQNRLHNLVQEAWHRSMNRLKVVTLGEAARFMMSAVMYGMEGIPILSLPEPDPERLDAIQAGSTTAAEYWVDWAADLFAVGRDHGP